MRRRIATTPGRGGRPGACAGQLDPSGTVRSCWKTPTITILQLVGLNLLIPPSPAAVHLTGMLNRQKQRRLGLIEAHPRHLALHRSRGKAGRLFLLAALAGNEPAAVVAEHIAR